MSDTDVTQARQDVVADVDEILEHIINANMLSMPYDVYSELFDAVDGIGAEIENLQAENAKLRELVDALYHIHFGTEGESFDAWEEFCPCDICEERHGGEAPCAYVTKDLADECCEPITKEIVKDRMRELGVEL